MIKKNKTINTFFKKFKLENITTNILKDKKN